MICRQRSPSDLSFHPDPISGLDDLDVTILKHVDIKPGISINQLASRFVFYNKQNPKEETRASYAQIYYRVSTLEKEGMLRTEKVRTTAGKERFIYPL